MVTDKQLAEWRTYDAKTLREDFTVEDLQGLLAAYAELASGALTDSGIAPTYPPELGVAALTARAEQAERQLNDALRERDELRVIVSNCASAVGAFADPSCSMAFLGLVPGEVAAVLTKARGIRDDATDRLHAVRKLLEENGCDCPCDHHPDERGPDCEVCLACRIGEAVGK